MRGFLTILVLVSIFSFSLVIAQLDSCSTLALRGDSNGDGALDITDAVYTLSFLFQGKMAPPCLQAGDINGDNNIDLSDPVYTLNHLFQGGPEPKDALGQTEIYHTGGVDESPNLAFLYANEEDVKIKGLPMKVEVIDVSVSPKKDIVKCTVEVYESWGLLSQTFSGEWPDGTDITTEPLVFLIGDGDGIIDEDGKQYDLEIICEDKAGQKGNNKLHIEIIKRDEPSLEPDCREGADVCCSTIDRYSKTHYQCVGDCDAYVEMGPNNEMRMLCNGPHKPTCGDIGPYDIQVDYDDAGKQLPHEVWLPESNNKCNAALTGRWYKDPLCLDNPDLAVVENDEAGAAGSVYCYVESMTVIRDPELYRKNYDHIRDDFNLPTGYIPEEEQAEFTIAGEKLPLAPDVNNNNGISLGPIEGWIYNSKEDMVTAYRIRYGFLVKAILKEGSNPEYCLKGQFIQQKTNGVEYDKSMFFYTEESKKMGRSPEGERGRYMNTHEEIKTKSLANLKNVKNPEEEKKNRKSDGYRTHILQNRQWIPIPFNFQQQQIIATLKNTLCYPEGDLWCADDYGEEMKGPDKITFLGITIWQSDALKYVEPGYRPIGVNQLGIPECKLYPPKIIWLDTPGYITTIDKFRILEAKKGVLPLPGAVNTKQNFISIVEDSQARQTEEDEKKYQKRWLCEQKGLGFSRNENVDIASGDPNKMKRVTTTPPSCVCKRQKREEGGIYVDDPGKAGDGIIPC